MEMSLVMTIRILSMKAQIFLMATRRITNENTETIENRTDTSYNNKDILNGNTETIGNGTDTSDNNKDILDGNAENNTETIDEGAYIPIDRHHSFSSKNHCGGRE